MSFFSVEESQTSQQLQKALLRIEQLEQNIGTGRAVAYDKLKLPSDVPLSSAEIISKQDMHILHLLNVSYF